MSGPPVAARYLARVPRDAARFPSARRGRLPRGPSVREARLRLDDAPRAVLGGRQAHGGVRLGRAAREGGLLVRFDEGLLLGLGLLGERTQRVRGPVEKSTTETGAPEVFGTDSAPARTRRIPSSTRVEDASSKQHRFAPKQSKR